jgi:hypothetical protein
MGTIETESPAGGRPPLGPVDYASGHRGEGSGGDQWVIGTFSGKDNGDGKTFGHDITMRLVEQIDASSSGPSPNSEKLGLFAGFTGKTLKKDSRETGELNAHSPGI